MFLSLPSPPSPSPFLFLFLFLFSSPVLAILQNVTITPLAMGIQYLPSSAWTVSPDSHATSGSFIHADAENATIVFTIPTPSIALFWHGFLPRTPARYSICIDCSNIDEFGTVVTIQNGTNATEPVVLFASGPLPNTTHSIVIRNLRNSIEGVVGEISSDSFSFTTDTAAPIPNNMPSTVTNSSNPSVGEIVGIIVASVIAAGLLLAIAKFCTRRRRQAGNSPSTKQPKIWRKSFFSVGIPWKRHRRTASSESSPIIEAVWKGKPLSSVPDELPIHNGQTRRDIRIETNQATSDIPGITVTSPTVSTTASTYSTIQPDRSVTSLLNSSTYEPKRVVRQSDPYASYATTYAAFSGVTNSDDDMQTTDLNQGRKQRLSTSSDSALRLPAHIQTREANYPPTIGTREPMVPRSSSSQSQPPSSFKGPGIRDGRKKTRTLSDKIKRGTLPSVPPPDEKSLRLSVKFNVADTSTPGTTDETSTAKTTDKEDAEVEGNLAIPDKPKEPSTNKDEQLSIFPTLSSDSSHLSVPVEKPNSLVPAAQETMGQGTSPADPSVPPRTSDISVADATFWSSHGDFALLDHTEELEQVAESSSDGVESILEGHGETGRVHNRPQSLQRASSPPDLVHHPSNSEGNASRSISKGFPPVKASLSIVTADTSNAYTTCSSPFSITPSVSDFPLPPFKLTGGNTRNSTSPRPSEGTKSSSTFTDLLASTSSPSSGRSGSGSASTSGSKNSNGARSHAVKEKQPPSAFAPSTLGRPRRPKAPSFKALKDVVPVVAKPVHSGSEPASGGSLVARTRVPVRYGSRKSSKSPRRRSESPGSHRIRLPIGGAVFAPPLPGTSIANIAQRRISEASRAKYLEIPEDGARRSNASNETTGSDVPFFMGTLNGGTSESDKDGPIIIRNAETSSERGPSRLTMASAITTTDEEYPGTVQVVMASRPSIRPDLPKAIMAKRTQGSRSATSSRSDATGSTGSSNGQWEMVGPGGRLSPQGRVQQLGTASSLSVAANRNLYRAVNVPVSARSERFDGGSSEASHKARGSSEPVIGFGSGLGMPWSPSFDWPASPPLNVTSAPISDYALPPISSAMPSSREQPSVRTASRRYDYPTSVTGSTLEGWNINRAESTSPYSRPMSQDTVASSETMGWKDILGGGPAPSSRGALGISRRESVYSNTSSFFGGARISVQPPVVAPPLPPIPAATSRSHRPVMSANTRQGWHALTSSSSHSPIERQRSQRQRQRLTGSTAVGSVNSIFAISQPAVSTPKQSLKRVDAALESSRSLAPTSHYHSP